MIAFLGCVLELDPLEARPLAVRIADLVVTAPWRSRGIAAALIASAECFARESAARALEVTALAVNSKARRAYEGLGFRESAVTFERPLTKVGPRRSPVRAR